MGNSPLKVRDLVCFSHLRWNFVYQRPQHLLSRFAKSFRVFFVEEPMFNAPSDYLETTEGADNVCVVVPYLQDETDRGDINTRLNDLIRKFFSEEEITDYIFWYYTPMALKFSKGFSPVFTIYDCMDELSAFKSASSELKIMEQELLASSDIVFCGGQSLYEVKKKFHPRTFLFPSSIDREHFAKAREMKADPADQRGIPHPRIGFFGVIDERLDIDLITQVARLRPKWQFVMIGPVVKIDRSILPNFHNIHYLGGKSYAELPSYLSGWDIAMIPFAHNESTRFISPTKTPEYLAAGKPVVSTPIIDVIRPYGNRGYVRIAGTADEFVRVCEEEMKREDREEWLDAVDTFISQSSWDKTWNEMMKIIGTSLPVEAEEKVKKTKGQEYV